MTQNRKKCKISSPLNGKCELDGNLFCFSPAHKDFEETPPANALLQTRINVLYDNFNN